jgi:hypothetical protein
MNRKEKCPVQVATTSQSNHYQWQQKGTDNFDSERNRVEKTAKNNLSSDKFKILASHYFDLGPYLLPIAAIEEDGKPC